METNRELSAAWREKWDVFSRRLNELQTCIEAGADPQRSETALLEVEKARLAYNEARDRLAARLTGEAASLDKQAVSAARQRRVKRTAHLLWELAGRPAGTAQSDWIRAERLVRSASAS